ncbi:MAG TPA: HAD-IA family hydrolase [Polyangiaceae bacterium]
MTGPLAALPRALVFDLDGTLIDSRLDIACAANHALGVLGFAQREVAVIAGYVGDGARPLLARAAEIAETDPRIDGLYDAFIAYYLVHPIDHTTLLPGVASALSALRELPLCVCTNKPRSSTDAVLAQLPLPVRFQLVVASDDLPKKKPDPLPLVHIAERLGLTPRELVMVGDGPQDIQCARAAGARSVGVEGIQPRARLLAAEPDVVLASLHELPALIQKWLTPSARDTRR